MEEKDPVQLAEAADTSDQSRLGPPDKYGRRFAPDGSRSDYPGDSEYHEFMKDGVRWVRLGDGREMPENEFFAGMMDGSIECGIHPLNLLF